MDHLVLSPNVYTHIKKQKENEAKEMLQSLKTTSKSGEMSWRIDLVEILAKANDPQYSPEQDLKVRALLNSRAVVCLSVSLPA